MRILVLSAHPDDEVLGCGGSIARWSEEGHNVYVHVISEGTTAQYDESEIKTKRDASERVKKILGIKEIFHDNLPDAKLDTIPILDIVKLLENSVSRIEPEVLLTQHFGDISQDHRAVFKAASIVSRPTQHNSIKRFLSYEVPSGTEWGAFSYPERSFKPNYIIDITGHLKKKLAAMKEYEIELREPPHPRSIKGIENLAAFRGQSSGFTYGEAFMIQFWRE